MSRILAIFALILSTVTATAQSSDDKTILVLDASNSMWGQIDGVAKITIAQEVIGELLQGLPADQQLGLVAYGHRREGDCTDIETMVAPGPDTRDAIAAAVNSMSPRGRTPLSAAVLAAAEELRYEDVRATVILVSDGRETCDYDPCQLGEELEKAGVDFTAHVVGFDIENDPEARAQLQCLAENTGGQFLTAENADELTGAMEEVMAPVEPEYYAVQIDARIEGNGPFITEGLEWSLYNRNDLDISFTSEGADISAELLPGDYRVRVIRTADEASAALEFAVTSGDLTQTLELPAILPDATLTLADSAVAGDTIPVEWTGPDGQNDYISTAEVGERPNAYETYEYTREGSPLQLQMPALPGEYEVRYRWNETGDILATRMITVTEVDAALEAVGTAAAGEDIRVSWTGPDYPNDYISVAEIGEPGNRYVNYTYTREGSDLILQMPPEAGEYEIRYIMNQTHRILATQPITVEDVSASITTPETAAAGDTITIEWDGPDYQNDYISVAEVGARGNQYVNYTYTREGSPLGLTMPPEPGEYEIRYVQNQDSTILASVTIIVEEVVATLEGPATAAAGDTVMIDWTGPDYQNDYISVAEIGARGNQYVNYTYTREGSPLALQMPPEPGDYEIRYVQNQDSTILTSISVTVEALAVTVTAPETAVAGDDVVIEWDGPDYQNDYIAVAEVGARGNQYINYTYTRDGSPLRLQMPTEPGSYEVRYVQNQDSTILASVVIEVEAATGSLTAPETATAGDSIVIQWEGPDYQNDYISVAEVGARGNQYENYTYTRDGSPLRLEMPSTPGDYEIRYVINQDSTVLTSVPITVEAATATLTVNATAASGGNLVVEWEGPDYQNDYIALAEPGAAPNDYLTYVYTREGSPLILKLPDHVTGDFEIRYIMNQDSTLLASEPLTIE